MDANACFEPGVDDPSPILCQHIQDVEIIEEFVAVSAMQEDSVSEGSDGELSPW